jgi:hypothetical protein
LDNGVVALLHSDDIYLDTEGSPEGLAAGGEVLEQEDRAAIILDAQVHGACVQIHAAAVLMLSVVEAQKASLLGVRV